MTVLKKIMRVVSFLRGEGGSVQKRTLRSISWVGATSVFVNALALLKGVILARLLTPEIFGIMAICMIVIRGIEIFSETGFGAALIHRQKNFEKEKDVAFTLLVIRGVLIFFVAFSIAPFVATYYEQEVLDPAIKILALTLIFNSFGNINTVKFQKELNFKPISYMEQFSSVFSFVFVVSLAYYFRSIWALVVGHVGASVMGLILSYLLIPGRPRFSLDLQIARELFSYGKFIMGLAIVVFLALEIDNILVGKLLGLTVLGYYVLAFTLANLPATHLSKVISRVLFPTYSELQNDLPALQRAFLAVYKVIAILIIPIAMVFVVFAPEVITILYGDKWVAAADALRILAVFGCLRAFSALAGYLFNAVGRPSLTFYLNLVRLVLLLIILIPLTQTFGLVGASVAVTLPMAIQFAVENRVIGTTLRVGGVRILKTMAAPVAWSMVMCVVFALLKIAVYIVDDNRVDLVVSDAFGVVLSYGGGGSTLGVFETLFIVTVGMLVYLALSFNAIATQVKRIRAAAARK